jgi:hypothetical protein
MINSQDKERHARNMHTEREELRQASRHFIRSMFRAGVGVALFPINKLPATPRQHFHAAGRELTYGVTTLVHELANSFEELAQDANTSANFAEGPHTDGEIE